MRDARDVKRDARGARDASLFAPRATPCRQRRFSLSSLAPLVPPASKGAFR